MSNRKVAVYNLGGQELLGHVSVHQAMRNIVNGKYRILEEDGGRSFGVIPMPKTVELVRYMYAKWKYENKGEVPFSKRGVLRRDNYTCAYCGGHATTVDHILPKWQGNKASWNNSIAACFPCNNKKGGRSPQEAGMPIKYGKPFTPTFRDAFQWTKGGQTKDDVVR